MKRVRLDDELVAQGICVDRADALRTLMAGDVSARGERLTSPGMMVDPGLPLHVKGRLPYVGRGGLKLEGALDAFGVDPSGLACGDIGCSTGGFTDCLLKRERVTLLERTNVVDLPSLGYRACCDLVVCDVSFTSIAHIIDAVIALLVPGGRFLTLVKPQFEAPASEVGEGGIVRDPNVRRRVLEHSVDLYSGRCLTPEGVSASPIPGTKGNVEFFLLGRLGSGGETEVAAARERVLSSIEGVVGA